MNQNWPVSSQDQNLLEPGHCMAHKPDVFQIQSYCKMNKIELPKSKIRIFQFTTVIDLLI